MAFGIGEKMAQAEQRQFEIPNLNLQVICEISVGSYGEEQYYPDSTLVPEGRTEILRGVVDVKYKKRVRYDNDEWREEWVTLDVDVADLIAENLKLQQQCEDQQRELNVARRHMSLYSGKPSPLAEENDAGAGDTSTE